MDRSSLSKRLKGLSEVFASENPMAQDLSAMSYVLENMSDEKFANVLNKEYTSDKEAFNVDPTQGGRAFGTGPMRSPATPGGGKIVSTDPIFAQIQQALSAKGLNPDPMKLLNAINTPSNVPAAAPRAASEGDGMFWNKEATEAVQNYLLKDVVGMEKTICCDTDRHLEKEQMPDATKKQSPAPTLTKEQVPHLDAVLKSDIVAKAKAAKPVNKAAAEEVVDAAKSCKKEDEKEEKGMTPAEKEKHEEEESPAKEEKEHADEKDASVIEGVELVAPMSEVVLTSEDETQLGKLFD